MNQLPSDLQPLFDAVVTAEAAEQTAITTASAATTALANATSANAAAQADLATKHANSLAASQAFVAQFQKDYPTS